MNCDHWCLISSIRNSLSVDSPSKTCWHSILIMSLKDSGTSGTHYHLQNTTVQKLEPSSYLSQFTLLQMTVYRSLYYMCILLYYFLLMLVVWRNKMWRIHKSFFFFSCSRTYYTIPTLPLDITRIDNPQKWHQKFIHWNFLISAFILIRETRV